ncbi:MAG: S26 family signal peptidase [Holosporaceae bacterium]|nr:S26 family signal peptidase [Holosporaceae bacterium]
MPEGYAFVAGSHQYSFDSRYKEFGFVDLKDIRGRAIGICK